MNGTEARGEEAVALALSVAVTVISAIGLLLNGYILFVIIITKQFSLAVSAFWLACPASLSRGGGGLYGGLLSSQAASPLRELELHSRDRADKLRDVGFPAIRFCQYLLLNTQEQTVITLSLKISINDRGGNRRPLPQLNNNFPTYTII
ncbi:hypothetical protein ACJJTC_004841 [Scirpophaga incertulas]